MTTAATATRYDVLHASFQEFKTSSLEYETALEDDLTASDERSEALTHKIDKLQELLKQERAIRRKDEQKAKERAASQSHSTATVNGSDNIDHVDSLTNSLADTQKRLSRIKISLRVSEQNNDNLTNKNRLV